MSMPFYVSPEQLMKDRADFARKGIARGRSVVLVQFADGILFVSENPSQALHKVSEIYDRIAFAAVGRYNEFENLRIAGVRLADMRGYAYDRRDVTGRGLANAYAQTLGTIFSSGGEKPYEVEIFVAEVGDTRGRRPDLPADLRGPGRRRARVRRHGRRRRDRRAATSSEHYTEGAALDAALQARGRRARPRRDRGPGDPDRRPRGRGAGPHPQPAAEVRPDPAPRGSTGCSATRPGHARTSRRPPRTTGPATRRSRRRPDDPADPTDQTSGNVAPLEDPRHRRAPDRAPQPTRRPADLGTERTPRPRSRGLVTNRNDSRPIPCGW